MKILVVEDNQKVARFLTRAFAEEGFAVDRAADGEEAFERAERVDYDLVVLDWMLPGVDGLSVCRGLRERGLWMPILMLTARADVPERIAALDAGADDYLIKPFDLGELLARTRALLRRARGKGELRIGPLTLVLQERRAKLDGTRLELTPREFALLFHLARRVGKVVPRMELLAKVWEVTFDPDSNVVDVHIKNLREKLGPHGSLIETVRGIGYRLAVPS